MSLRERLFEATWDTCQAIDIDSQLLYLYVHLQRLRHGSVSTLTVADTTVSLPYSNWFEYKRLHGILREEAVLEQLLGDLREDDVVWDVGATIGMYSCFVATRLESGSVLAFEPEPQNRQRLTSNLERTAPAENWRVEPLALAGEDRQGKLALDADTRHPVPGMGHYHLSEDRGQTVQLRRGDSLVEDGYPAPDILKIDVQGAELAVLRGLERNLTDTRALYAELHPRESARFGTTPEEVETYLRERGFSLTRVGGDSADRSDVYHIRGERRVDTHSNV